MAEKRLSEGGFQTGRFGAGVDGAMLAATVIVVVLAILSGLMLGFAGQQVASLAVLSVALVIGVWTLARRRAASTADTEGSAADTERSTEGTGVAVVRDDGVPGHPEGQIIEFEGQKLGVIDFGTDVSRVLRCQMDKNILTRGEPFRSGGILDTACLPIAGAGAAATSALLAGNVFLATANPATLMQIGAGVGSAVVGSGGTIVAQAPFVAASSAILPVVAPVMLFTTLSSMMICARLDQIQGSLDQLAKAVELLLVRHTADDYATLASALGRLRDVSEEFDGSRRFTDDMRTRLALTERDLNVLRHKYAFLLKRPVGSELEANLALSDIELFTAASLADIQIDHLRSKLALQDNPDDAYRRFSALNSRINDYEKAFRDLLENDSIKEYREDLQYSVGRMGWWKRNVSRRKARMGIEAEIDRIQSGPERSLATLRSYISELLDDLASQKDVVQKQAIIYYRENGGHGGLKAYYTSDWELQEQPRTKTTGE
ncbi:MAG: hypothetical protein OXE53_10510 [Deltaproteobacteria bacterium]|nr:hypothetical protein [Deltaproteobacteria bacterium]